MSKIKSKENTMEHITLNVAKLNSSVILSKVDRNLVFTAALIKLNQFDLLDAAQKPGGFYNNLVKDNADAIVLALFNGAKKNNTADGQVVKEYSIDGNPDLITTLYYEIPEAERVITGKSPVTKDKTAFVSSLKQVGISMDTIRSAFEIKYSTTEGFDTIYASL